MSKFHKTLVVCAVLLCVPLYANSEPLGLGRDATPEEIAAWDIDIRPDGYGLPAGRGSVEDGEIAYTDYCAMCHGDFGEGIDRWPVLAGGDGTLASDDPVKTVGSYWPYLSTVWDYVHRAMPFGNAQSLSDDEVYAITAYILYLNDIVDDDFELSAENFTEVGLPNASNFIQDDRAASPIFVAGEVCMTDCKPEVQVTGRARVIDVTPEDETAAASDSEETQVAAVVEPDPELVAMGEGLWKQCQACHQVGEGAKHRVGPVLNGIIGAPVGGGEGFKYSKTFVEKHEAGEVWDEQMLSAFLADPRAWAKGTRMVFKGFSDDADRLAMIEFLKTFPSRE